MAEHRFVTVNGIRTHYVAAGEGEPLLLLHGLGASLMAWALNIEPLSRKFSVYAIDIPGHGDSEKPDMDYLLPTAVDFVRDFMRALGIERASIAGNSMGGMIALKTAIDFPELVDRLVLVDAAGLGREVAWFIRAMSLPLVGRAYRKPLSPKHTGTAEADFLQPRPGARKPDTGAASHKAAARLETGGAQNHTRVNRLAGNSIKVDNGR